MDSVAMDSPRLAAIKAADIQTHHAEHMDDDPWLAIPMNAAREFLAGYKPTEEETASVPAIMAGYCRLLDEAGMTFTGQTKRDVENAALAFLSNAYDWRTRHESYHKHLYVDAPPKQVWDGEKWISEPNNRPQDGRVCDCEDAPCCGHYEL